MITKDEIKKGDREIKKEGWEVLYDGKPLPFDRVLIIEGTPESLEAVRKLLVSKEVWLKQMRGANMVKW